MPEIQVQIKVCHFADCSDILMDYRRASEYFIKVDVWTHTLYIYM